jgi:hypothetical protein
MNAILQGIWTNHSALRSADAKTYPPNDAQGPEKFRESARSTASRKQM